MDKQMKFSEFVKAKRLATGKVLRVFCQENGFNWIRFSSIERGLSCAPRDYADLQAYGNALGLESDSEITEFIELAEASWK